MAKTVRPIPCLNTPLSRILTLPCRILKPIVIVTSILAFTFTVCGIELMIRENGIRRADTVNATGQLIPLIIGVATFARLLYIVFLHDFDLPPLIWGFSVSLFSSNVKTYADLIVVPSLESMS